MTSGKKEQGQSRQLASFGPQANSALTKKDQ